MSRESKRGFAAMSADQRREISAKGGRASHGGNEGNRGGNKQGNRSGGSQANRAQSGGRSSSSR